MIYMLERIKNTCWNKYGNIFLCITFRYAYTVTTPPFTPFILSLLLIILFYIIDNV